jgi:aryl-alcohol dehydrogenase-like predicted oxidoreductase
MEYVKIPGIEKSVSRIVMGNVRTLSQTPELLDMAFDRGITIFDTARVYGENEKIIGAWLERRGIREKVVVISKGCHPSADRARVTPFDLTSDLFDSLARLRTGYIDLYLLHRDDRSVPVPPIMDTLHDHFKAGRIRACGVSNWRHDRIAEANEYARTKGQIELSVSSPHFSLARQFGEPWGPGSETITGPENEASREWYESTAMIITPYSSLGRGLFSGRITRENFERAADEICRGAYCHEENFKRLDRALELAAERGVQVAQIALAYLLSVKLRVYPVVNMNSTEELDLNIAALAIRLSQAEVEWLNLERETR